MLSVSRCYISRFNLVLLKGEANISRLITFNIRQSMLKLPTHSGFHNLFLNYSTWIIPSPAAVALLYHVELCKLFFLNLFITECWSFYFLNHERKLFSVIRMSKEPSQLHNMVKQRYSGRRGYNPCYAVDVI
jgi:hypothetical protein